MILDMIKFDANGQKTGTGGGGSSTFDGLTDTDITSADNNDFVVYDGSGNLTDRTPAQVADLVEGELDVSQFAAGTLPDARIAESNVTQHEGAIDHDALTNFSVDEHRTINDSGTTVTDLWSASKIDTELSGKAASSHTHTASDISDFDTEVSNNTDVAANTTHRGASSGVHGATGAVVGTTDTQTLTNKTLTAPTIGDLTNATHDHEDAAGGGSLDAAAIGSGTLGIARGGTGLSTFAANSLLYASALDTLAALAAGTDGHVLTMVSGSPAWAAASGGGGGSTDYILLTDTTASLGGTFTSGVDVTRVLTTEVADTGNHCTLSSNQFTLTAGTYRVSASAPGNRCDSHQAWLYNTSDSTTEVNGTSADIGAGQSRSFIVGRFTIASSKTFEIRHRCQTTRASDGLGENPSHAGGVVRTIVELWKE